MAIRLGVVGLGVIWENTHYPILRGMPDFAVSALCARREEKQKYWGEKIPGAKMYADYREMITDPRVDAVLIITPPTLNAEITIASLEAGKDVLVEKPAGIGLAETDAVIAAEQSSGKRVYVLEQFLYNPQLHAIREILEKKQLGEPAAYERITHYLMDAEHDVTGGYGKTEWRQKSEFPLGHIYDGGVHDVALMNALFGLPRTIFAKGKTLREGMGKYDHILSILDYGDRLTGVFSHSAYLAGSVNCFYLHFTGGSLYIDAEKLVLDPKTGDKTVLEIGEGDLYRAMWERLAELAPAAAEPPYTLGDARDCALVLDAVERSIDTKSEVNLQR